MLNKEFEINRQQLFYKFNPNTGIMHEKAKPWEKWDEEWKEFRGEFDALWRTGLAYITYNDADMKQAIINCFRKYTLMYDHETYWYQASRCSNRFSEDDVSRDQVLLALAALEYHKDPEVSEIAKRLPYRLSRQFKMTISMKFWVNYLATRKKGWRNAFLVMQIIEWAISISLNKIIRPLIKTKIGAKIYKAIRYPMYALHFSAWQYYVVNENKFLDKVARRLIRWENEKPNLLIRILAGGNVTEEEILNHQSTNTWIWQRRLDFPTTWIYILSPSEKEYNDMEVDILKTLTPNNHI